MTVEKQRLKGHAIVVTGAAFGIGQAIVMRCAEEGADLVAVDRDREGLIIVAEQVEKLGGRCVTVCGDIREETTVEQMVNLAESTYGRLDGLVNNAGISGNIQRFEDASNDEFDQMIDVNLRPVWKSMQLARKSLGESGRGAIVNISSIAALRSSQGVALYGMTKGGVSNLTVTAAREFARDTVRVNALCPGPIDTSMIGLMEKHLKERNLSDARKIIQSNIPMQRYGSPKEVATAACFLLSEDASFITGVLLPVDGGTCTI